MKARCQIEIGFPDKPSMDAAAKAVAHEGGRNERSVARVEKDAKKNRLTLHIEAQDALRRRPRKLMW
jgi:tRNA threonylcarbamoyladenosine modification (KEOPS) complex  Pcc1 subunit